MEILSIEQEAPKEREIEQQVFDLPLSDAKRSFERHYLQLLLEHCRGNVGAMALKAGRYRADIYRLLSRHGISHEQFHPRS